MLQNIIISTLMCSKYIRLTNIGWHDKDYHTRILLRMLAQLPPIGFSCFKKARRQAPTSAQLDVTDYPRHRKQPCSMFQHEERQSLFVLDKQLSHASLITGLSSGSLLLMKAHFCYYFQGCRSPGKDLMWHNIARKVMKHYSDVMISAAASPNHQCLDC